MSKRCNQPWSRRVDRLDTGPQSTVASAEPWLFPPGFDADHSDMTGGNRERITVGAAHYLSGPGMPQLRFPKLERAVAIACGR